MPSEAEINEQFEEVLVSVWMCVYALSLSLSVNNLFASIYVWLLPIATQGQLNVPKGKQQALKEKSLAEKWQLVQAHRQVCLQQQEFYSSKRIPAQVHADADTD